MSSSIETDESTGKTFALLQPYPEYVISIPQFKNAQDPLNLNEDAVTEMSIPIDPTEAAAAINDLDFKINPQVILTGSCFELCQVPTDDGSIAYAFVSADASADPNLRHQTTTADSNEGPPPRKRAKVVPNEERVRTELVSLKKLSKEVDRLSLECEWSDCSAVFDDDLSEFLGHVSDHIRDLEPGDTFSCAWEDCPFETPVARDIIRHINFHAFHTKIKALGRNIVEHTGIAPCRLNDRHRNIIPEFSAPFKCAWDGCLREGEEFAAAQQYYWHVQGHAEDCQVKSKVYVCRWSGCKFQAVTITKVKDHLKSHTQERLVGCFVCGSLFTTRNKFYDHCKRQSKDLKYMCSYCNKKFATERLLRDHIRSHINSYKCPHCDMTCTTPSSLSTHMMYKHNEDRQFSCDLCDYKGKRNDDLMGHMKRIHFKIPSSKTKRCRHGMCKFVAETRAEVKKHEEEVHGEDGPRYCCHLCEKRFTEGRLLSRHLIDDHNCRYPSGHSRFRYRQDGDGFFHLQTIRFESAEIGDDDEPASLRIIDEEMSEPGTPGIQTPGPDGTPGMQTPSPEEKPGIQSPGPEGTSEIMTPAQDGSVPGTPLIEAQVPGTPGTATGTPTAT